MLREHLYRHHSSTGKKADGLSNDQIKQLKKRKREADKAEDIKWREMYRIVFPKDGNATPSPCWWPFTGGQFGDSAANETRLRLSGVWDGLPWPRRSSIGAWKSREPLPGG
jgi:hypothetical protein